MTRKRKQAEQVLSIEQATIMARNEVERFWIRTPPLLYAIKEGDKEALFPLHPSISEKPWFIFFADPTEFAGESTFHIAREFYQRYSSLNVGFLMVIRTRYKFLSDASTIEKLMKTQKLPFPAVMDRGDRILNALGCHELPTIVFLKKGEPRVVQSGKSWLDKTEFNIQDILREDDPGLATLPYYKATIQLPLDVGGFEFLNAADYPEHEVTLTGTWHQEKDHIVTADPKATLRLLTKGSHFAIVGKSLAEFPVYSRMSLTLDGQPVYDAIMAPDTSPDLEWGAVARIRSPRIYHILYNMNPEPHELFSQFPMAHQTPIALYGVRFGQV